MMNKVGQIQEMTKRERVDATMKFQETDRIPVYDLLLNDAVIEYFSRRYPEFGEEGIKAKCEAIGRMLDMTRAAYYGPKIPCIWTDEDGFVRCKEDRYINAGIIKRPFSDEKGAKAWINRVIDRMNIESGKIDLKRYAAESRDRFVQIQGYIGDDTVVLEECETGLDEVRANLGFELFSYVLADEPVLISEYIRVCTEKTVKIIHATADKKLTPCAMTAGDIAMKGRLMHSPEWLNKDFFPNLKKLVDAWHEHDVKCLYHSDGYIMDVIPELIEAGVDGLNPIEIVAGMDLEEVKKVCGNRFFITGGIDISQLLCNGTTEKVRHECLRAIKVASPGYFIGSTSELDNGSRLENILTMLEVAWGKPKEEWRF